jgi:hypothetical protein
MSMVTNPDNSAWVQENFGRTAAECAEHCVLMGAFGIALGEEALRLING